MTPKLNGPGNVAVLLWVFLKKNLIVITQKVPTAVSNFINLGSQKGAVVEKQP